MTNASTKRLATNAVRITTLKESAQDVAKSAVDPASGKSPPANLVVREIDDKHRRIGLHFAAAEAISEYIKKAEVTTGPLFRARRNSRLAELSNEAMCVVTMYNVVQGYLSRLSGAMRDDEVKAKDGSTTRVERCIFTPHSLRATTATLLFDAGVDIIEVKKLLGHRHVTTTQIYDKRRRSLKEGASRGARPGSRSKYPASVARMTPSTDVRMCGD